MTRSGLYRGELFHARRDGWTERTFRYPLYVACLDLDELPALAARLRLLSLRGRNLFGLRSRDYHVGDDAPGDDLAAAVRAHLAARGLPVPARIELITQLRVLGYAFNPVSFFLGYDQAGALETVITEINNTFGGNRCYALGPAHRLPSAAHRDGFVHDKDFFVSPFLHDAARYEYWFAGATPAAPTLDACIDVRRPDGDLVFCARLTGDRAPLDDRALLGAAIRYPLMTVQVIGLIHWQAMKLHWARVPYRRPGPDHGVTRLADPPR